MRSLRYDDSIALNVTYMSDSRELWSHLPLMVKGSFLSISEHHQVERAFPTCRPRIANQGLGPTPNEGTCMIDMHVFHFRDKYDFWLEIGHDE